MFLDLSLQLCDVGLGFGSVMPQVSEAAWVM